MIYIAENGYGKYCTSGNFFPFIKLFLAAPGASFRPGSHAGQNRRFTEAKGAIVVCSD